LLKTIELEIRNAKVISIIKHT